MKKLRRLMLSPCENGNVNVRDWMPRAKKYHMTAWPAPEYFSPTESGIMAQMAKVRAKDAARMTAGMPRNVHLLMSCILATPSARFPAVRAGAVFMVFMVFMVVLIALLLSW